MDGSGEIEKSLIIANVDPDKQCWGQLYQIPQYGKSDGFDHVPHTIILDWLEMMGTVDIPDNLEDGSLLEYSNEVVLEKDPYGRPDFKSSFTVYFFGDRFAKLSCHPKKLTKSYKPTSANLKIENHILYSEDWHSDLNQVMDGLGFKLRNVTRLDIAVDGLNHIPDILNAYSRQDPLNRKIKLVGRATFAAKIHDKETMYYKNFQIGSMRSEKMISVYLKTSEIEKSNKQYIREFWRKNGLAPGDGEPVYRVELRMRSKYLKMIRGFCIEACTSTKYLFTLFKRGCHNFFEFSFDDKGKNVSRQRRVKFLPHHFMNCVLLEKHEKPVVDDIFKAKMSIHLAVKSCLMGQKQNEDAMFCISDMHKNVCDYGLRNWFEKKVDEWFKKYNTLNPNTNNHYVELESLKLNKSEVFNL